jgi:hypothetical protein
MGRRLPSPLREFCCHVDNDGRRTFDFAEWHALLCGIGDGLLPWRPDARAWALFSDDWWYYIVARGVTTFIALALLLLIGAAAWN